MQGNYSFYPISWDWSKGDHGNYSFVDDKDSSTISFPEDAEMLINETQNLTL